MKEDFITYKMSIQVVTKMKGCNFIDIIKIMQEKRKISFCSLSILCYDVLSTA